MADETTPRDGSDDDGRQQCVLTIMNDLEKYQRMRTISEIINSQSYTPSPFFGNGYVREQEV
jgi:hypothetical protein